MEEGTHLGNQRPLLLRCAGMLTHCSEGLRAQLPGGPTQGSPDPPALPGQRIHPVGAGSLGFSICNLGKGLILRKYARRTKEVATERGVGAGRPEGPSGSRAASLSTVSLLQGGPGSPRIPPWGSPLSPATSTVPSHRAWLPCPTVPVARASPHSHPRPPGHQARGCPHAYQRAFWPARLWSTQGPLGLTPGCQVRGQHRAVCGQRT